MNSFLVEQPASIVGIFLVFAMFAIIIIVPYIFGSIGSSTIGKRAGIKNSWLAWIPIIGSYINCEIATKKPMLSFLYTMLSAIFMMTASFYSDTDSVKILLYLINLIFLILYYAIHYIIYKNLSDKYIMMTVFTVISCGLTAPFFLFAIRNNDFRKEQHAV